MRLQDKVAIVTGGASGMGAATARIFAREGAKVVIADLLADEGKALAKEIGAAARFQKLDVTKEADWKNALDATLGAWGKVDVLVNNAGISGSDPDLLSLDVWNRVVEINQRGVFLGLRTIIPAMQANKKGSIVNTSSISGLVGQTMVHMAYNASKAAVHLMTKAAAVQFAKDGIRVNSVHPGVMPPMRTSKLTADPKIRAGMLRTIPMGRVGTVDEVANANLFLASDEASYVTGTELVVDGGYLAM